MSDRDRRIGEFVGWRLEDLAAETGATEVQTFRLLEAGVRRGEVARLDCGGVTLYARVAGDGVAHIPPPGRETPILRRAPRDRQPPKRGTRR